MKAPWELVLEASYFVRHMAPPVWQSASSARPGVFAAMDNW